MSSNRGGVLAAVLIGVLAAAVLGVAVLVFTGVGVYVARNVRVETARGEGGETVKIETPVGAMRLQKGKVDPKRLGIPIYPGATESTTTGEAANVEFDFGRDHKQWNIVAARYSTTDPAEKVVEYYRRELPHWIVSHKRHGNIEIAYTEGGYKRVIGIHERSGRTEIALACMGEPPAN